LPAPNDEYETITQAAHRTGYHRLYLAEAARAGDLDAHRDELGHWRVATASVDEFRNRRGARGPYPRKADA
jgi:hypothetical protein